VQREALLCTRRSGVPPVSILVGGSPIPDGVSTRAVSGFDPVSEELLEDARARDVAPLRVRERLARWGAALSFLAAAVPLAVLAPTDRTPSLTAVVLLIIGYAVSSRVVFEVGSGFAMPTQVWLVPMYFVLPARELPLAIAVALVTAHLPEYLTRKSPLERVSVQFGNAQFTLGPALVMLAFNEPEPGLAGGLILVVTMLAQFACDFGSSVAREWLALRIHPRELIRPLAWVFMIDALLAPIGLLVGLAARATLAAYVLPLSLLGLVHIFARERRDRLDQALELSSAYRGTAFLLGDVVEADDEYTGTHSRQVVDLVMAVCDRLNVDPRDRRKAEFAALLHDIGKIRVPSEIINKPGALSPQEREIINAHTIEGERLLRPIGGLLAEVGTIVRSCHEHYDGKGYPDKLAGDEIPLIARIVSCCDAFNAMTTDRSYRKGRTLEAALVELDANKGTQFDPVVVDALVDVLGAAAPKFPYADTAERP
jgi:putative nucleotidyltransferase with HDIG domain